LWFLAVLICLSASLYAQNQPAQTPQAPPQAAKDAPQPPADAPEEEEAAAEEPVYVRRISIGITGGGNPWYLIGGEKVTTSTTTPPLETTVETNPKDHYVFGGGLLNLAVLETWAVNLGLLYRTAEFESTQTLLAGVDNPNTIRDERTTTTIKDATKARLFDFPFLIRRYNIGRHEYGHRWFLEAGPSLRHVSKIRTTRDFNYPDGTAVQESSPTPHKKNLLGVTAGFGGQFIDPIGVRVIPEIRYTKWFGGTFDTLGLHSRRHQLDIMISFSF
jgi:hypothetical protein